MLSLGLRGIVGKNIWIGEDIYLCFYFDSWGNMKVGIEAPKELHIVREELLSSEEIQERRAHIWRNKHGDF